MIFKYVAVGNGGLDPKVYLHFSLNIISPKFIPYVILHWHQAYIFICFSFPPEEIPTEGS